MYTAQDPLLITIIAITIILLLLSAGFVFMIVRTQQRHSATQRKTLESELETLKKERLRIARDLHDELSPQIVLAYRQVEACSKRQGDAVADLLNPAANKLKNMINRIGQIIYDMDDERITKTGLEVSIRQFIQQYIVLDQLEIHLLYRIKKKLTPSTTISFYRITQELIHNTIKHANASSINIRISEWKSNLYFEYKDNGRQNTPLASAEGIGLKSLEHRVLLLGGKLNIDQKDGHHYYFNIPGK